ncbi:hypothetical protein HON52_00255 [Candidatus Uhrbacteria bacterium]|nr:hypothetical protein [Candidatus Uhrbacteria bacterium]
MHPRSIDQITENIGSMSLLGGGAWSFDQLPLWCDRACSLHLNSDGIVFGLTIDRSLLDNERSEVLSTGLFTYESENKTLIYKDENEAFLNSKPVSYPSLLAILPWNDAILTEHSVKTSSGVRINSNGIVLHGRYGISEPHQAIFAQDTSTLAQLAFTANGEPYPLASIILQGKIENFLEEIVDGTISVALGEQDGELVFSIQLPVVMDQQEAAELSRELIKPLSLSTLEWTIPDGTNVEEIRFDDSDVTVETHSDGNTYYMEVFHEGGVVLRITQSQENLTISNREISLNQSNNYVSSCARNTRAIVRPRELLDLLASSQSITEQSMYPLITSFTEVAFTGNKAILCW